MKRATKTKLRVLHIGNIANYAYNIGKVLQTDTISSDVITWDYYHINARPIWEDGRFDTSTIGDQYFPRLPRPAEANFDQPDWYWHGPRTLTALGLIARNEGRTALANLLQRMCEVYLQRIAEPAYRESKKTHEFLRAVEIIAADMLGGFGKKKWHGHALTKLKGSLLGVGLNRILLKLAEQEEGKIAQASQPEEDPAVFDTLVNQLMTQYLDAWKERSFDPILLRQYQNEIPLIKRLIEPYDVVIGYAIDGIWPLVAGRKYLAYEFGTIRNLPFEDGIMGKLASVVYRNSTMTIVTNCDNEAPAKRLERPYRFLPHVINENGLVAHDAVLRADLQAKHGGEFYIFHPPRQHWDDSRNTNWDKGNDKLFRALAELVQKKKVDARCLAVNWGESLANSKALVEELGISKNVIWIQPQAHRSMMRYIAACDVIADQFTIPTFGGIPPKAFYARRPVVTCFDPALHRWCFDEMPPLMAASSTKEIAAAFYRLASDKNFARDLAERAHAWYERENSNSRIRTILVDIVSEAAKNDPR